MIRYDNTIQPAGPEFHSRTVLEVSYYNGRQDGACGEPRAVMLGDSEKANVRHMKKLNLNAIESTEQETTPHSKTAGGLW